MGQQNAHVNLPLTRKYTAQSKAESGSALIGTVLRSINSTKNPCRLSGYPKNRRQGRILNVYRTAIESGSTRPRNISNINQDRS